MGTRVVPNTFSDSSLPCRPYFTMSCTIGNLVIARAVPPPFLLTCRIAGPYDQALEQHLISYTLCNASLATPRHAVRRTTCSNNFHVERLPPPTPLRSSRCPPRYHAPSVWTVTFCNTLPFPPLPLYVKYSALWFAQHAEPVCNGLLTFGGAE